MPPAHPSYRENPGGPGGGDAIAEDEAEELSLLEIGEAIEDSLDDEFPEFDWNVLDINVSRRGRLMVVLEPSELEEEEDEEAEEDED